MSEQVVDTNLPRLPLSEWRDSYETLQKILQIIGKIKWELAPAQPRWWHVAEYISMEGFTTGTLPIDGSGGFVEIVMNVHSMTLDVRTVDGRTKSIVLGDSLDLVNLYEVLNKTLTKAGVDSDGVRTRFSEEIAALPEKTSGLKLDRNQIMKFWQIMLWVNSTIAEFQGQYRGITSPVHLFWHHMDIASSRFARPADDPKAEEIEIAFGFWAGDESVPEPAFYSYTWPSPDGLEGETLSPDSAIWKDNHGSPMAFLAYHEVIDSDDPKAALLAFLKSAYQAGATLSKFDVKGLETSLV